MEFLDMDNLLKQLNLTRGDIERASQIFQIVVGAFTKAAESYSSRGGRNTERSLVVVPDPVEIKKSRKKLIRVIDIVNNKYDASSKIFKENFLEWEEMRNESIKLLGEIVEQMHYDRKVCNIVSIASNSVAVVGGLAAVFSLAFPPAAAFVVPIAISSFTAMGVGGATSGAAYVADFTLVVKHIKHAQRVTKKEQDSVILGDYLIQSEQLEKAMSDLISFDVWLAMWDNLKDFNKKRRNISVKSEIFVKAIKSCVSIAMPDKAWVLKLGIEVSSAILTTLISMILFHRRTRYALHIYTLLLGVFRGIDASLEIAKLITLLAKSGSAAAKLIPQAVAKRIAYGTMAGIGVALDVTMIVLSSIELHKDKICAEGQKILAVKKLMEDEAVKLRSIYEAMTSRQV